MVKKIEENYNIWAHQYDANVNPTRDLDKIVTVKSLSKIDFSNVLELGCGTGKNTEWFITKADRLVGLDFSKNMLDLAMRKVQSDKVNLIKANIKIKTPKEVIVPNHPALDSVKNKQTKKIIRLYADNDLKKNDLFFINK